MRSARKPYGIALHAKSLILVTLSCTQTVSISQAINNDFKCIEMGIICILPK